MYIAAAVNVTQRLVSSVKTLHAAIAGCTPADAEELPCNTWRVTPSVPSFG
jgi:hypothetical protein